MKWTDKQEKFIDNLKNCLNCKNVNTFWIDNSNADGYKCKIKEYATHKCRLTKGKYYKVIQENDNEYSVYADKECIMWYEKELFKEIVPT
jgi:hypothetical protein